MSATNKVPHDLHHARLGVDRVRRCQRKHKVAQKVEGLVRSREPVDPLRRMRDGVRKMEDDRAVSACACA
jgi:hypothetical protein